MFLVDLIVTFFACYYEDDFEIIEDLCAIAYHYLTGWFFLDLVSILPFELMMNFKGNRMVRVVRIGKLVKLIRVSKIFKVLKIIQEQ